jgi:hypothetical protein
MVDYSNTIIYKITAPNGKFMVSFTTSKFTQHRKLLQTLASGIDGWDERAKFIRESGGYIAVKIVPLKSVNVTSSGEALAAVDEVRKEISDNLKKAIPNPLHSKRPVRRLYVPPRRVDVPSTPHVHPPMDNKRREKLQESLLRGKSSIRWPCGMCRTNKCLHIKEPSTENVFTEDYVLSLVDEHQGNNY